jgi:hypothetical protein
VASVSSIGVVQQRGGDGRVVELQIGEDRGDFEGMGEVGIARGALLRAVRAHGVDVGAVEQRLVACSDRTSELVRRVRIGASSRDNGVFVVLRLDRDRAAVGDRAGAMGCQEHEFESVRDLVDAIFDGDACHKPAPSLKPQLYRKDDGPLSGANPPKIDRARYILAPVLHENAS